MLDIFSNCGFEDGKLWKVFLLRGSFLHFLCPPSLNFLCWQVLLKLFCIICWSLFNTPGVRGKGRFEKFTFLLTCSWIFVAGSEMDCCNWCFLGYSVWEGVRRWKHWCCPNVVMLLFCPLTGNDTVGPKLCFFHPVLFICWEYWPYLASFEGFGGWWFVNDCLLQVTTRSIFLHCISEIVCLSVLLVSCRKLFKCVLSLGRPVCRYSVWGWLVSILSLEKLPIFLSLEKCD